MPVKSNACFFLGHHKAATSWWIHLLSISGKIVGKHVHILDRPARYNNNLKEFVLRYPGDIFALPNSTPAEHSIVEQLGPCAHVFRNPKSTIVSAYWSHLKSHPIGDWHELADHRSKLEKLPLEEGLLLEIEFSAPAILALEDWEFETPKTLNLRYEDFVANPIECSLSVAEHLGLVRNTSKADICKCIINTFLNRVRLPSLTQPKALPPELIVLIAFRNRFERLKLSSAHYRSGRNDDHTDYFTEKIEAEFRNKFGDLPERLGYQD